MIELNEHLPEAETDKSSGFSIVWLIPLVALLVGGWLAWKAINEKGPEIEIVFSEAEGLEPGQTRIKYKNVDIGKIRQVSLTSDLSQVIVTARLNKSMSGHLNEHTRFWIVRPRISSSGISGLSTLISGIHIAIDPGKGDDIRTSFQGLEKAPEIESSETGTRFTLTADSLGSLTLGAPVLFRQIEVGYLSSYQLSEDGRSVDISVFIDDKYTHLVKHNTRFWYASGLSIDLGPTGLTADIESIVALISGGIAFETPIDLDPSVSSTTPANFPLHPNYRSAIEKPYSESQMFVMYFGDASLKGLQKGAPVEFRGINIGKVIDVALRLNHETLEVKAPVLIELHPQSITPTGQISDPKHIVNAWIEQGLRAQLATSNLLTGQLYINLDFVDNPLPVVPSAETSSISTFPTVPPTMDRLADSATQTLEKIANMPLLEISQELHKSMKALNEILNQKDKNSVLSNLNETMKNISSVSRQLDSNLPSISNAIDLSLKQLSKTLSNTSSVVSDDSRLIRDLRDLLKSLNSASRSFESLTNYLERNPSTLLYGKPGKN